MAFADLFTQPGTPHWWLVRLERMLVERNSGTGPAFTQGGRSNGVEKCERYYEGDHELAFAMAKFRAAFGAIFEAFASNWCKLLVDTSVERLQIDGFRFDQGQEADQEAWRIWQANGLDAGSMLAHTDAVKCGTSYLLVTPGDGQTPQITVEHPSQFIVAYESGSRSRRAAALKRWVDDSGKTYATVYLPDGVYKFERGVATDVPLVLPASYGGAGGWRERAGVTFQEEGAGIVTAVPLENDPHLVWGGRSDLEDVVPLQDAINKTITDALINSEFHGYPQRWATGVEIPTDPVTGELRTDLFAASSGSVWAVGAEDAKFGQFEMGDLEQYTKLADMLVRHLSAQSRTPPHYLVGEIVNASGDALKAAETGLSYKTKRKQLFFGDPWEEALRVAFLLKGDQTRARAIGAETIWSDPESRSWGELVDAAVKMRTLGVSYEAIWTFLGFTPQQQREFRRVQNLPDPPPPDADDEDRIRAATAA